MLINNATNSVINGDCLFYESIGRTDLPGGNHNLLLDSIRKELFTLPKETKVYCGHGPETFIGHRNGKQSVFKLLNYKSFNELSITIC